MEPPEGYSWTSAASYADAVAASLPGDAAALASVTQKDPEPSGNTHAQHQQPTDASVVATLPGSDAAPAAGSLEHDKPRPGADAATLQDNASAQHDIVHGNVGQPPGSVGGSCSAAAAVDVKQEATAAGSLQPCAHGATNAPPNAAQLASARENRSEGAGRAARAPDHNIGCKLHSDSGGRDTTAC